MREEKIVIIIDEEGNSSIDVSGVKGKACLDITSKLEEALGVVSKREAKKEMQERPLIVKNSKHQTISRG